MQRRRQGGGDVGGHRDAAVAAGQAERRLAGIVARQQQEIRAQPAAQARDPRDVAGGIFQADDARQLGQPAHGDVVEGAAGARRHVVEGTSKNAPVNDGLAMDADVLWFRRGFVGAGSTFLAS